MFTKRIRSPVAKNPAGQMIDRNQIKRWLTEEGISVSEADPVHPAKWHLVAQQPSGVTNLLAMGEKGEILQIQRGLSVNAKHRNALAALPSEAWREVKFGMIRDLLLLDVQYIFTWDEQGEGLQDRGLLEVGVLKRLFRPHFNKADVIQSYHVVVRAGLLLLLHIRHAAGDTL